MALRKIVLACVSLILIPFQASSSIIPVDLSAWGAQGGSSSWNVAGDNNSVLQTINGDPTVFFESGSLAQGQALSGTIEVNNAGDDDFIGFVLGFQSGELTSASAEYWLIDWKQNDQFWSPYGGTGKAGLSLSRVDGALDNASAWVHNNKVTELARGSSLGSTGWVNGETYTFDLVFTSTNIQVFVDGVKEIDEIGTFSDGAFGFYNFSQSQVTYAGLKTQDATNFIPEPTMLSIVALGLVGLIVRKRKY